jgi:HAD superfamily hydrolase (TIGR01509 family)
VSELGGSPIDAVIFDCDGTLVDSEPILLQALADEAGALDPAASFTEGELLALKGQRMSYSMDVVARKLGRALPADFEARARARMAPVFRERLQPIPGAIELLRALKVPYCVASNGPLHKMQITLAVTGLLPLLEGRIFSAYEVGSFKPDPGLFLHAARALDVRPERCAVVEDSLPGIEAGLAAGMTVYALPAAAPLPEAWAARVLRLDSLEALAAAAWNRGT